MNPENKNPYQLTERGEKLKKASKIAVTYVGGAALTLAVTVGAAHAMDGPETRGRQTVTVEPGDTVDDLVNEHVDGGASHTGAVRTEVLHDPDNADVFENGQLDPGETLELPDKIG